MHSSSKAQKLPFFFFLTHQRLIDFVFSLEINQVLTSTRKQPLKGRARVPLVYTQLNQDHPSPFAHPVCPRQQITKGSSKPQNAYLVPLAISVVLN